MTWNREIIDELSQMILAIMIVFGGFLALWVGNQNAIMISTLMGTVVGFYFRRGSNGSGNGYKVASKESSVPGWST